MMRLTMRSTPRSALSAFAALALGAAALTAAAPASASTATAAAPAAATTQAAADSADHPLGDLAPTPTMGWNSWNQFHCDISAELIKQTADAIVSSGMKDAGYEYVNIDDCWSTMQRDADGRLVPDPVRFPEGIKGVADYVHGKGLKLGIYSSAGTYTCQHYPASLGYEEIDAQTFADWDVDLLKYDNCGDTKGLSEHDRYKAMHDALAKVDRDILFSLCDWGAGQDWLWNGEEQIGHQFRNTADINASWGSVLSILDLQADMWKYTGPNNWADPDMLEVGVKPLTHSESRAHMALWAVLNAPLITGTDVRSMSAETRELLTNERVIAVDQDWSGQQGKRIARDGDKDIWAKRMSDGSMAVVLLNRGTNAETISITGTELGLAAGDVAIEDVWNETEYGSTGAVRARVQGHDAAFFIVRNAKSLRGLDPLVTFETSAPEWVNAGEPFTANVNVINDGETALKKIRLSLNVPSGWTAAGATSTQLVRVAPGETGSLRVELEPRGTETATGVKLSSSGSWLVGRDVQTASDSTTFGVAVAPGAGEHQVSDLSFLSSSNAWGPVERDQSNGEDESGDGNPLTIGGTVFEKGLGVNAPSAVDIFTGGTCSAFSAQVGIDDEVGDRGDMEFVLLVDGVEKARVQATGAEGAKALTADISGAQVVRLFADAGASGPNYDHGDWADAKITC